MDKNNVIMDKKLGETTAIYGKIYKKVFSVMMFIVTGYLAFHSFFPEFMNLDEIKSLPIKILLRIITLVPISSLLYYLVYKCVYKMTLRQWLSTHKEIYVRGTWLHIHIKDNLRVGLVNIQQNFYSIDAKGMNVSPEIEPINKTTDYTEWRYYIGEVFDDATRRDFIGCYEAKKHSNDEKNDGIHALTVVDCDSSGYPIYMRGAFGDTVKITSDGVIRTGEHGGNLLLYKPSPRLLKYLSGGNLEDKLRNLFKHPDFKNEEYVKNLNSIIEYRKKHGNTANIVLDDIKIEGKGIFVL